MNHPEEAARFNQDVERTAWHDQSLWFVREKRDLASAQVPEWEALRTLASAIKDNVLSELDTYLEAFEKKAKENGIHVHWAEDASEHNRIVLGILQEHGASRVVKSKSMLTEECHLNPFLEEQGVEVVDTDLGERIVQLAEETPSHIVLPAIHLKKEDIGTLFHKHLGTEAGATDPTYLTRAARAHLRTRFLKADAAITGVNFAIADTGSFVVCTNEGNADLGVHLAPVHIACMGIEKIIPRMEDLSVFLRLLARSATGQHLTTYTSHFTSPRPGAVMHLILVDNGRTEQLAREAFRESLKCIRCGACMNTCPIYRRSGGHSYGTSIPGPIGSVLAPGRDLSAFSTLPFASTLCGSCSDVCPVKIPLHDMLYQWRQEIAEAGHLPKMKTRGLTVAGKVFAHPAWYRQFGKAARMMLKWMPDKLKYNRANVWGQSRDLPETPQESFREWYLKNRSADG